MSKTMAYGVKIFLCLLISTQGLCQTEKFDIAAYTPPKDWKKDNKQGLVTYTNVNTATNGFCIIALYASIKSTGDAQQDFKKEWKDLVISQFKVEPNPKTETQTTPEGWKVVTGVTPVKENGIDFYIFLSVASGFGKTMSIRTSLNDLSYSAQVDEMLQNIKLNKTIANTPSGVDQTNATGKFGTMIFTKPAGWKEQQYQNGVVLTPSDLPANEHLNIQLMQALNFSGAMEEALKKSYDEICTILNVTKMYDVNGGNYTALSVKKSFRGWEYIRCSGGIHVNNGTEYPDEYGLDLFVVKINNRYERVAIVRSRANCNLSRYYPSDRLSYNNSIDNFLFSLQFSDWNEEPLLKPGNIKNDGIVGIWKGISLSVGAPTSYAQLGAQYKVFSPIFLSNGQAYFGSKFPTEGLDELDTRIRAENNRRDWGTYTFSNGRGILKMPYGEIPLRIENNKFIITPNKTDHGFYKLNTVDGATFNGTYFFGELNGNNPTITFTNDGKFIDNGVIKVLYHEYVDCINPAIIPGKGTYEVKNYSVLFNYTDGRKIKIAFPGTDYDIKIKSPATLTMSSNDDMLIKK